jgi:hypothetical protein
VTDIEFARFAGLSAWLAAAMTVVGAVTLLLFFSRGGRWGTWNDASSVVLMLAMIPVALLLTIIALEVVTTVALVMGAVGIGAMLVLAALQALLVAGRVTYEQTKVAVLIGGGVVGIWYLLTAIVTGSTGLPDGMRVAAAVAGLGFIAVGIGFLRGGQDDRLAQAGGLALFVASLVFLVWIGALLLARDLTIPAGNA